MTGASISGSMGDASIASDWGMPEEPPQPVPEGDHVAGSIRSAGPDAVEQEMRDQPGPTRRKHCTVQFKYAETELGPDMRDALAAFDLDQNGTVSTQELLAGAQALKEVRGQSKFLRKMVVLIGVALVVALASIFGVSLLAVELGKEVAVSDAVLTTPAGRPVQVASADMYVAKSGDLRMRGLQSNATRLTGDEEAGAHVHTMEAVSHATVQLDGDVRRLSEAGEDVAMFRLDTTCWEARAVLEEHMEGPTTPITVQIAAGHFLTVAAGSYSLEGGFGLEGTCTAAPCNDATWSLHCPAEALTAPPGDACTCKVDVVDVEEPRQRRLRAVLQGRRLTGPPRELQRFLEGKAPGWWGDLAVALQAASNKCSLPFVPGAVQCSDMSLNDGERCVPKCESDMYLSPDSSEKLKCTAGKLAGTFTCLAPEEGGSCEIDANCVTTEVRRTRNIRDLMECKDKTCQQAEHWKQSDGPFWKCDPESDWGPRLELNFSPVVVDTQGQTTCQLRAVDAGHTFYSFDDYNGKCFTTSNCKPVGAGWTSYGAHGYAPWRVYSREAGS
jgi:hypothetical protein